MKNTFLTLSAVAVLAVSCSDADVAPAPSPESLLPVRVEESNFTKDIFYDAEGRIDRMVHTSFYPNDVRMELVYDFQYSTNGQLARIQAGDFRFEYAYDGQYIARTNEYIGDHLTQYHLFTYDSRGLVTEIATYQNVPELGGWSRTSRGVYEYNAAKNMTRQTAYYDEGGVEKMIYRFDYLLYDNKPSYKAVFDVVFFNPQMKYSINNPKQMESRNRNGILSAIDYYTYEYNQAGYPVKQFTNTYVPSTNENFERNTSYTYEQR